MVGGFFMLHTQNIQSDFNLDLTKNQDSVCFAIESPRYKQYEQCSHEQLMTFKRESENLYGDYLRIIPMRNVGEGRSL